MDTYNAPLEDMRFLIDELLNAEANLGDLSGFQGMDLGPELTTALLDQAATLASDVLAPMRRMGDESPGHCTDGRVTVAPGYREALQQLGAGGWIGLAASTDHGGQGLPELYGTATHEMWGGADMAFALMPFLSIGTALAIEAHGSEQQKHDYLEKLNSGEWAGSMNLTESGAGSDLGVMNAKAVPEGGHYRIYGQKIFITWGDHDLTDNIVHLVLAKIPGAPQGSRGISLFIVPKFLLNADGSPGERNDVYPVSCEHKLGIHGSPTCVMAFGDNEGAIGYLLGEENNGLACMFTMMNESRLKVALQALGTADAAYRKALTYSRERVQGGVPIIEHPDVKRMLLTMKAQTEGMRGFAYAEALTIDLARRGPVNERPTQQSRIDFMIPVLKGWLSEMAQEIASNGVQIHGGIGYIEEAGAAQYLRDVRITSIYEGTNGIQAADLVARKLGRDGGATAELLLEAVALTVTELDAICDGPMSHLGYALASSLVHAESSTRTMLGAMREDKEAALGVSFDYMMQLGYLFGGWQLARAAVLCHRRLQDGSNRAFYRQKIATATFYCEQVLPRCEAHAAAISAAYGSLRTYPLDWI